MLLAIQKCHELLAEYGFFAREICDRLHGGRGDHIQVVRKVIRFNTEPNQPQPLLALEDSLAD